MGRAMKALLPIFAGLLALCLELFFRQAFGLTRWAPDLATVVLIWLGVSRGWAIGAVISAAVIGLLTDGFIGSPAGVYMMHAIIVVLLGGTIADRVRSQSWIGRAMLGLGGGILSLLVLIAVCRVLIGPSGIGARLGDLFVPRTCGIVLGALVCFPLLDRLTRIGKRRPDADVI